MHVLATIMLAALASVASAIPTHNIYTSGHSSPIVYPGPKNDAIVFPLEPVVFPNPSYDKSGRCPPIRSECPSVRFGPVTCLEDAQCPAQDKCCYDTCLEHKVCKPPLAFPALKK
ncbi:unnamed protein product [Meganyctiphanes norvegica]|uniref:WAP domain-containing protein n=1 Tax=Meganyctiphanes norvegica TaxID=48144 RepID=A0AAV2S3B1_MEGNR